MYTQVLGARRNTASADDGSNGGIVLIDGDRSINRMANREEKVAKDFRSFRSTTIGADFRVSRMKRDGGRFLRLPSNGCSTEGVDVAKDGAEIL